MPLISVKLPDIGEGVTEAELVEWSVQPGDLVQEDDVLACVMTDKASVEIPSAVTGRVVELGGAVGETIAVGGVLLVIEVEAEAGAPAPDPAPEPASDPAPAAPEPALPAEDFLGYLEASPPPRVPPEAPVLAAPATRARAQEAGIDLAKVAGTGPEGRVTASDLDAALAGAGTPRRGETRIPVIGLRRKIARRLQEAHARIPQITIVEEVDVTQLEELRAALNAEAKDAPKLTLLPFLAAALARALRDHPEMNAHFDDQADEVIRFDALHLGIATATGSGLVVPVLRHAEALGLRAAAAEIARLAEAARAGRASREELTGSTLTLTSLGPLGAIATTPLVNPPEVAILGINKIVTRPHWDGRAFVPRQMMNISASFDHRVIDGYEAALFVNKIKTLLEMPARIFIAP
ncbi:MAG: dihydrolipoamide acetyltransferase family protein [Paracoccaceae bacterium]